MKKKLSDLYTLHARDIVKGLIVAFITTFLSTLAVSVNAGSLPDLNKLRDCALAGLGAGISYLIKNYFTNSHDEILKSEPKKRVVTM